MPPSLPVPELDVHGELFLPHHIPVVGNVAALVPHKGQRDLIDAAALVVRELPDVRFVVFGEGELRASLEQQVKRLYLQKYVLLPGFRPDVLGLMKDKDLRAIARSIARVASHVVAVQPSTKRALESAAIAKTLRSLKVRSSDGGAVAAGFRLAARRAGRMGMVLVTGSHFVVGEMLAARQGKNYLTISQ